MNTHKVKGEDHYQCREVKAERDTLKAELAAAKTLAGVLLAENQRLREAIREQIDGYRDDGMFDDLYLEAILEGSKP